MIERKRLLALDFYKKEHFSGSDSERSLRYRVERIVPEDDGDPIFRATVWPEPYSYECTDPALFLTCDAPFSEDGLETLVAWMNEQSYLPTT